MAYWIGSFDGTGANTAVKFVISDTKLLVLAMDFFAGSAAWSWAYDVMLANSDCECYITTHAWLTSNGTHFQRTDTYGPNAYSMADAPYSNSSTEAWSNMGVNTWSNLFGVFGGHDLMQSQNSVTAGPMSTAGTSSPAWYWQQVPVQSASLRGQTVQQLYVNTQELDAACSVPTTAGSGTAQTASVFLLSRRLELGLLEGRMISTQSGNWFGPASASASAGPCSTSETVLFSVPFTGLQKRVPNAARRLER
jgi:hypothetical protein